ADHRRLRREVRSAERLQRVSRQSRVLRLRSRALHQRDGGDRPRRRLASPRTVAAHLAECRAARAPRPGAAGFGGGGGVMIARPASRVDRRQLPQPDRGASYVFPGIVKSALPNGLRVWTVAQPSVPVVTAIL